MCISGTMFAMAAEAIVRGMVPLLGFVHLAGRMPASYGRFEPPLECDPGTFVSPALFFSVTFKRLAEKFTAASTFFFFKTFAETGTGRGP
jgi:hypothetical protein